MLAKFQRSLEIFLIFGFGLFLFTWGVADQEITGFESRFYLFALEMWQKGFSWFPTTYFKPYPDYPVTSTILIYLTASLFGKLNKLTAILPSSIAAAFTLVITYLIGEKENKKWGRYAVCFLLLTFTFLKTARLVALDMYPTLLTACCFYFVYIRDKNKKSPLWILISLFLILSFAFRGPIGLVMPAGVVASYYLMGKQFKKLFLFLMLAGSLLIASTAALLMLAYYQGSTTFMHDVLRMEVLGRLQDASIPFYFYFAHGLTSYLLSSAVTILVVIGLIYLKFKHKNNIKNSHLYLIMRLMGWILIILIGMSLPADKKIRYILPIAPALALLAAYLFVIETKEKYFIYLRAFFQCILLFLPLILLIMGLFLPLYLPSNWMGILVGLQIISLILFRLIKDWRIMIALITGALAFLMTDILLIEPAQLYHERARDLVTFVEKAREVQQAKLVFYQERPDGLAIKYLINMPQMVLPIFMQNETELMQIKTPAFFITSETHFDKLSPSRAKLFHVITKGQLGHAKIVVLTNTK